MSAYCPDCGGTSTDHYAKCANAKLREALADLEKSREALRGQVADFRSCNRARQAAEEECARLRDRVAELEQAADIATEINNEHVGEADRLRAALSQPGLCAGPERCECCHLVRAALGLDAASGGRG